MIEEHNLTSKDDAVLEQEGVVANNKGYTLADGTHVESVASPLTNLQCGVLRVTGTN